MASNTRCHQMPNDKGKMGSSPINRHHAMDQVTAATWICDGQCSTGIPFYLSGFPVSFHQWSICSPIYHRHYIIIANDSTVMLAYVPVPTRHKRLAPCQENWKVQKMVWFLMWKIFFVLINMTLLLPRTSSYHTDKQTFIQLLLSWRTLAWIAAWVT